MKLNALILILLAFSLTLSAGNFMENPWQSTTAGGVTLQYRISPDGMYLENHLSAQTTGWVAVGYRPTDVMQDANFIIGYVSGSNANVRDDWGTSSSTHASDTSLGGVSNLSAVSGSEAGGTTHIYFTIPMNSGDQYDRQLVIGTQYQIILAQGENGSDNYTGMHSNAGYANININAPVSNDDHVSLLTNEIVAKAYPNPFNPQTTISWQQKSDTTIGITIYNLKGEKVFSIQNQSYKAGDHSFVWNGTDYNGKMLSGGSYYIRLISPKQTQTLKLIMLK